jgi:hypothetical protein
MSRGRLVAGVYKTIFDADPLLLTKKRQREYGRAMLQHFLVYRPLTTSKSHTVDFQQSLSRPALSAPMAPTQHQIDRYLDARKKRTDLSSTDLTETEIRELMRISMISDGSTEKRADNQHKNHADIEKSFSSPSKRADFNHRLRIATVGFRVSISRLPDQSLLGEQLCFLAPFSDTTVLPPEAGLDSQLGRTRTAPGAALDKWHEGICALIEKSLSREAKIVVLPEFGLTPVDKTIQLESDLQSLCANASADNFIFGGTRHEDRYNRGIIFSKRHGQPSTLSHWHYKIASAKGLGENVFGPAGKGALNYESSVMIGSDEALLAIGVCYDTYDPTTFLNLFLDAVRNYKGSIPRIILVPSFNPSPDFVALLRDLSYLARCAVVYVNGLSGDAAMFMCGFDIADFESRLTTIVSCLGDRQRELQNDILRINARASSGIIISPRDARQRSLKSDQLQALQVFERRLMTLHGRGDMDHIITVEDCPTCGAHAPHTADMKCFRDIQYYNLHPGLLSAIFYFRCSYFGDEQFLPEPFRWDKLDIAAKAIDGP